MGNDTIKACVWIRDRYEIYESVTEELVISLRKIVLIWNCHAVEG